jgi:acyl-CoA thioesterase-1
MYPELAAEYGALYHSNFLGALANQEDMQTTLSEFMQDDGIHPNARGVALIVEDIGPKVAELAKMAKK